MPTCGRTPGQPDALWRRRKPADRPPVSAATRSEPAEVLTEVVHRAVELAPDLMHSGAQLLEVGVWRALGGIQRQDQPVQCLERVVEQVHGDGCTLIQARRDAVFWLGASRAC